MKVLTTCSRLFLRLIRVRKLSSGLVRLRIMSATHRARSNRLIVATLVGNRLALKYSPHPTSSVLLYETLAIRFEQFLRKSRAKPLDGA